MAGDTMTTINTGKVEYAANLVAPWGGATALLTEQQVSDYQRDPDGFAAAHFGLTRDEYREWLELGGAAKCGAKTKAGKPCGNLISGQLDSREWKARHRSEYCPTHGGV
jgi:hypothetical protein